MTVYTYDAPQDETGPTRATQPGRETIVGQRTSEETIPVRPVSEPPPGQPGSAPQPPAGPATGSVQPLRQVLGKAVISVANGQKLGTVRDVLIDPQGLRVAALVLSRGGFFNRETAAIPAGDIQAWGMHAVMVDRPDIVRPREELPGNENWISASDQIYGRPLLSADGVKIGEVQDIEIESSGKLAAYDLTENDEGTSSPAGQRIPAGYTRSIGRDVIIVERTG